MNKIMKNRNGYKLIAIAMLSLTLQAYSSANYTADERNYTEEIIAEIVKGIITTTGTHQEATAEIYNLSTHRLIWLNNKQTETALKLLNNAASKGLKAENYQNTWLNLKWQELKNTAAPSFNQLALFDTTLTSNFISYLSDLRYGRINPQKIGISLGGERNELQIAQALYPATKDGDISALADKMEPNVSFYRNLKRALQNYQTADKEHKDFVFKFDKNFTVGMSDPQIPKLRQLLANLDDYIVFKATDKSFVSSDVYDKATAEALKNFQYRHGLAATGSFNKETLAALNVPLSRRIEKIELGLERLRWIPQHEEDRLIIVNIPSFQLWAFNSLKDEKTKPLSMRVVVGKADAHKTPLLSSKMQYLDFRPQWAVPPSIIKNEILPKLRDNPNYLEQHNMRLINKDGAVHIRQGSGERNALGLVKFMFPNDYSVYLHDTPSKKFFSRDRRDFSHGCVRVAEPALLAEFALKNQKQEWTTDKIYKAMTKGQSRSVSLENPIPVVIFYSTAMAINGGVSFFDDVYDYDEKLRKALEASSNRQS